AAPALWRATPPREPRGFAEALTIYDERKISRAHTAQQPESFGNGGTGTAQRGAVDRHDLIHIAEAAQQRRVFLGGEKSDFGGRKIFAECGNGGQRENHVAD